MMQVSVEVKTHQLDAYVRNLGTIEVILDKAANDIAGRAQRSIKMRQSRHMKYKRGKRGRRVHWSSAPGYPPNSDTGKLVGSIKAKPIKPTEYYVVANAKYAIPLEIGTRRMAARPFMLPAVNQVRGSFILAIQSVLKGR